VIHCDACKPESTGDLAGAEYRDGTKPWAASFLLGITAAEEIVVSTPVLRHFVFVALSGLIYSQSFAACTVQPIFLPLHYRVGADTTNCQYNDLQSAINAVGECPTIIDITREHTYTNQHLIISGKPNLTLQGWGDGVSCVQIPGNLDFPPYSPPNTLAPLVSLDGSGSGGRVLSITGNSNVTLRNLTVLRGATAASASGGGINFDGQGALTLTRSTVSFNNAGYGAGINMNGSSGPATLTLGSDTLVITNTASTSGGGIRMQGNSRLYALQPKTLIGYNHAANGYGGGLEVLGPARADIGSPGYNGLAVIYGNDAAYGGGMDILTFDDGADAIVRLFTIDPHNPVQVSGNSASHTGGAVYLKPLLGIASEASANLCAYDFRIDGNSAQEGAAIYSDADYSPGIINTFNGGVVKLNQAEPFAGVCAPAELLSAFGAVACAPGVPCNQFVGNNAEDSNGQATEGSMILLQDASSFHADRFSARANTGAHLLREIGDGDEFSYTLSGLRDCLLADNIFTQELVAQTDGTVADITLDHCTIAGNQIGAPYAFLTPGSIRLSNSIIDQPGRATVDPAISNPDDAAYLLTNDRSTLPDTAYIHQGTPSFVDAGNGDYHLLPASEGVDSAPAQTGSAAIPADLDGQVRVVDLPTVPNSFGPLDLGAYEVPLSAVLACAAADTIFCDGFDGN
jgi:predicted outer membrane repeat protein